LYQCTVYEELLKGSHTVFYSVKCAWSNKFTLQHRDSVQGFQQIFPSGLVRGFGYTKKGYPTTFLEKLVNKNGI
jgi:hypothetical protein